MGDRSPKDKLKKQKQHDKDLVKQSQHKQENMMKNRRDQGKPEAQQGQQPGDQYKKAG